MSSLVTGVSDTNRLEINPFPCYCYKGDSTDDRRSNRSFLFHRLTFYVSLAFNWFKMLSMDEEVQSIMIFHWNLIIQSQTNAETERF